MMSTFTQILYQIVYSTKNRDRTLCAEGRAGLFNYMGGVLRNKKCFVYQIGGVNDHIHIVTALHPSLSLAGLVKDLKLSTNNFISEANLFPSFSGWQSGYAAFTYSIDAKKNLVDYVFNQETHHKKISFEDELIQLLKEHQIEFDKKYLL